MSRWSLLLVLIGLLAGLALGAQAQTVVVNGQKVAVPMIEKDGKAYVDAAAFAKLLGATATYDKAAKKLTVTTKKPAAPATPATPAKPATGGTAGGAMLPGDNGEIGKIYAMGKGDNTIHFSLTKAEFVADRVLIGDHIAFPKVDEKLLVIHYTLQNPHQREFTVNWATLNFTVVDAKDTNHEYSTWVGDERNKARLDMALKPTQKVECYTYFRVPAAGVVPKLMVLPTDGSPILRYDLRGKVAALPAPIADPKDKTGATALEEVPTILGATCHVGPIDAKIEKMEIAAKTPRSDDETEEGMRYVIFTVVAKNMSPDKITYNWGAYNFNLWSTDDESFDWNGWLLLEKAGRTLDATLNPGQESRGRFYFPIPEDATPARLKLWHDGENTRNYIIDLSKKAE